MRTNCFTRPSALIVVVLCVIVALVARGVAPSRPASGLFFVQLAPGADTDAVARSIAARGGTVTGRIDDLRGIEARLPGADAATATRLLAGMAGVAYAEPVVPVVARELPPDPLFGEQSSYLSAVNAPAAWNISTGNPGIVVAVVDTGVDIRHPNLEPNIWQNPREIPNNGIDDDGNGCVDDVNGCSFVSDSSPGCQNVTNGFVNDDIGHGTFVAGIIGAAANRTGIVGVARNVRIMPVKVLDCFGSGDSVATARGITYAARNGARVINLSLGGLQDSQVIRDAVAEATARGVLVVAAAGNDNSPVIDFPARLPEVLAVGAAASGNTSTRAFFSDYGPDVDVVAVGQDIIGTVPHATCLTFLPCLPAGDYARGSGTSFSAPQASGLAALMLSLNPSLSPAQLTAIIDESATALPPGTTPGWAGQGRLNMFAALQAVQANRPPGDACTVQSVIDGESFTCTDGRTIRLLQMDTPLGNQCGADWARAALQYIFLPPGRTVYLRYDVNRIDGSGRTLAAPLWRGADGNDYNMSIVMVFVGLARASGSGSGNVIYDSWARASETWAKTARWNMWAPGRAFAGGC
ncbi:MAG: S8 family serine peptidase [Dehalococcoidia bacterium]|nr:S8 family serine peptidase [Dehalococcoidia bacterium]